jgi:PEP-CTERM motif
MHYSLSAAVVLVGLSLIPSTVAARPITHDAPLGGSSNVVRVELQKGDGKNAGRALGLESNEPAAAQSRGRGGQNGRHLGWGRGRNSESLGSTVPPVAVPEPTTVSLFGSGVVVLLLARRRVGCR